MRWFITLFGLPWPALPELQAHGRCTEVTAVPPVGRNKHKKRRGAWGKYR